MGGKGRRGVGERRGEEGRGKEEGKEWAPHFLGQVYTSVKKSPSGYQVSPSPFLLSAFCHLF